VRGVREFHAGAEWHLHEVRYVWEHDGVLVRRALTLQLTSLLTAAPSSAAVSQKAPSKRACPVGRQLP
jgi:hypothetical protein